jgi:hypothetical protein
MVEKGEKVEKSEVKEVKKGKGRSGIAIVSLILALVLIALLIVVARFPFVSTNAVKEMVPFENCTQVDIPYASNYRTGLNYDGATDIASYSGEALYRYTDLQTYLFANIRNTGNEEGVYCLNAQAYVINGIRNENNLLNQFQNMIAENSDQIQQLDNWSGDTYIFPVCTEKPISPIDTEVISLWKPALLSNDLNQLQDLRNVYILFTVISATSEKCSTISVENTTQQEVTKYCSPWIYIAGKC